MCAGHRREYSEETIERYVMGKLSAAEAAAFEVHLLACPHCLDRLEEAEQFVVAIRLALSDFCSTRTFLCERH